MANAWERARSEAKKFFGDDTVYLEKAIIQPRHVEIQVLGDRDGNMVHVFERDCSIQRRNQKVVEETPSPAASRELVARMGAIAVQGAKAVGYHCAGTFEFLLARGRQLLLPRDEHAPPGRAPGDRARHRPRSRPRDGDASRRARSCSLRRPISSRAARPSSAASTPRIRRTAFSPRPGRIESLVTPAGPGIRDDGGAYPGCEISSYYDPLISKLCVWAPTRERAVARMRRALSEYVVTGIRTNLAFHEKLFEHPEFVAGNYDTGFIERHKDELLGYPTVPRGGSRGASPVAVAIAAARMERATGARRSRARPARASRRGSRATARSFAAAAVGSISRATALRAARGQRAARRLRRRRPRVR